MCDKELLVGYLYDELDQPERRMLEQHLSSCAECRGEVKELRITRGRLSSWTPPAPELELQVVRGARAAAKARYWTVSPAWGLAAAAMLILSIASAVANVEVKVGPDGLTLRTGAASPPAGPFPAQASAATVAAVPDSTIRRELEALGLRIQHLETGAGTGAVPASPRGGVPQAAPEVLRAVRQLVADSESRQQQELARRISQVLRDVEAARRVDLDRTQRALVEVQGIADTTTIRQREMENHFLRAVQQPK
jgi:anti-sigma factor RsiW